MGSEPEDRPVTGPIANHQNRLGPVEPEFVQLKFPEPTADGANEGGDAVLVLRGEIPT